MDLRIPKLDELKDRFGARDFNARDARSARPRHAAARQAVDYDDFGQEDFGEYAFDDNADYAQDPRPSSTGSFSPSIPKLVTADDVRAHTQYTPSEDPQATRPNRDLASLRADEQRSPGLNSLFETSAPQQRAASASETGALRDVRQVPAGQQGQAPAASPVVEPRVTQRATRILTVIKPESYADAERIAKILKSGDVAVLSLRNTPEALGKRILDFSFGVACALDARVECVSGHVFALTRGIGLTDGEAARLRDQGLM